MHGRPATSLRQLESEMTTGVQTKSKGSHAKTMLVPIDFSPASRRALKYAFDLSGESSSLVLLHVMSQNSDMHFAKAIESARQRLAQFCTSNGIAAPELDRLDVRIGLPFREILECAKDNHAEMIVLGLDQSGPLDGIALGHTADRVSRYAKCPVLLVREEDVDVFTARAQ